jgi:activator of 2-hydroxyglutaryl-CoA dehydratase
MRPRGGFGAGVDVGSTQTKAVIVDGERRIVARTLIATGANVTRAGEQAFRRACEAAGLPPEHFHLETFRW